METPRPPLDEKERLHELASYGVLDTPPEAIFDGITQLIASTCQVPIALISLIDSHRQWFKSRFGLEATETSREISFCAHALSQDHLFTVPDARQDPRFSDNPLVTDQPAIRFYAGMPLLSSTGHVLGTLCVIDTKPRTLTSEQAEALRLLSFQVVRLLEHRRMGDSYRTSLKSLSETQAQLAETSKLASIGTMMGNIAHEINNPLAVILGRNDQLKSLLQKKMLTAETGEKALSTIEKTTLQIAKIIRGLLNVSRKATQTEIESLTMRSVIEDVLALCEDRLKKYQVSIEVIGNLDLQVMGHSTQVVQVILNLVRNSFDAIKEKPGSWIKIEIKDPDLRDSRNESLEISVTDSGPGIPPEIRAHMMDPYFTTKPKGEGTGLGLSISKTLIEQHGGKLLYDTQSPNTRFTLTLPHKSKSMLAA